MRSAWESTRPRSARSSTSTCRGPWRPITRKPAGPAATAFPLFASALSPADRFLQELFIENEYPPRAAIYQVYEFLRRLDDDPIEMTHAEIREAANIDLNESAVGTVFKILESRGGREVPAAGEHGDHPVERRARGDGASPSLVDRLSPQAHVQRTVLAGLEGLVRDRLGEPVYFRPDEFASALGLDRPALVRA